MKTDKSTRTLCVVLSLLALGASDILGGSMPAAGRRVVISLPQKRLQLIQGQAVLKTYAVAVGMPQCPVPWGAGRL